MALTIRQARRTRRMPRATITGISGGGKTMTALYFLHACITRDDLGVVGKNILYLDTEKNSASLYSSDYDEQGNALPTDLSDPQNPKFNFLDVDVIEETGGDFALDWLSRQLKWLRTEGIEKHGIGALALDSLSHFWFANGGALDEVETVAKAKYKGDTYRAWGDVTPKVNNVIDEIIALPIPVIVSVRSKHAYERTETTSNGRTKTTIARVGDAPVFRRDLLYEFDVAFSMVPDDDGGVLLTVDKTRYSPWAGVVKKNPNHEFFAEYLDWLAGAAGQAAHPYYYGNGEEIPSDKVSARRVFSQYVTAHDGSVPETKEILMSWYGANSNEAAAKDSASTA